jgi:isochorismate pyruvate lyase
MILKKPDQCVSMEDVRNEIDKIDHQIINLFSERLQYVEEIVRFKKDEVGVVAQERKEFVINQRAEWAAEKGLDSAVFKKIYTLLVESNIKHELELLKSKKQ